MATITLPVNGSDDNLWGTKLNTAISAVNTQLESVASGAHTFLGVKTFSSKPVVPAASWPVTAIDATGRVGDGSRTLLDNGVWGLGVPAPPRIYIDGVIHEGTLVNGTSLLASPMRISDSASVRMIEFRIVGTKPTSGTLVFEVRRTTGATSPSIIGTVTVGTTGIARIAVTAPLLEGDLVDVFMTANTSNLTTAVIAATLDSKEGAAATATGVETRVDGFVDTFTRADQTGLGSTENPVMFWTVTGSWSVVGGRARHTGVSAEGRANADTKKVNHSVQAKIYGLAASNFVRLNLAFIDPGNLYGIEASGDNNSLRLYRVSNFTSTNIWTSVANVVANGNTLKVERINGNQFIVSVNGVVLHTTDTTHSSFPSATRVALDAGRYNSTSFIEFDDVEAN